MTDRQEFRVVALSGDEILGFCSHPEEARSNLVIVYLHGFGSAQEGEKAEFFRTGALEIGLGFCSFDFRGHGRSGGSIRDLTLSRCLADVGAVIGYLRAKGTRRFAILGSSMGGLIGLWYAALHPQDIVGGVHIAPALGMAAGLESLLGEKGMRDWRRTGTAAVTNELGTFDLGWGLAEDLALYPTERLIELHSRPVMAFQGKLDDRVDWRQVEAFAQATVPTTTLRLFREGDHRLLGYREAIWGEMAEFLAALAEGAGL
ncbi:MAG: alpha/beta fold hydrolase [Acidobacteriota bacterium]|nr:alpha/beta fold hydrolase [Acidobacteriota bacterium]